MISAASVALGDAAGALWSGLGRASLFSREPESRRRATLPDVSEATDLLGRCQAGDRGAFRELFERHRLEVTRLVYRMTHGGQDLEDLVQEVFIQVHKSLPTFRSEARLSTWIFRIAVNVVLMHRRAARSRPVFAEEAPADVTVDAKVVAPDEDAGRRERVRAFQRILDRLPEKKRLVFVLHELEGVTPAEIAKIVGAPVLTVRTRLFYARREIEAMLADEPSLAGLESLVGIDTREP